MNKKSIQKIISFCIVLTMFFIHARFAFAQTDFVQNVRAKFDDSLVSKISSLGNVATQYKAATYTIRDAGFIKIQKDNVPPRQLVATTHSSLTGIKKVIKTAYCSVVSFIGFSCQSEKEGSSSEINQADSPSSATNSSIFDSRTIGVKKSLVNDVLEKVVSPVGQSVATGVSYDYLEKRLAELRSELALGSTVVKEVRYVSREKSGSESAASLSSKQIDSIYDDFNDADSGLEKKMSETIDGNYQYLLSLIASSVATSTISNLSSFTTDDLAEGTLNLYFSTSTAVSQLTASGYSVPLAASTTAWQSFYNDPSTRITLGTGLSWSGGVLNAAAQNPFNQSLNTTDNVAFNNVTVGVLSAVFGSDAAYIDAGISGPSGVVGLYNTAMDPIAVFNSNVGTYQYGDGSLTITSSGNVGIGTTTPTNNLVVSGGITVEGSDNISFTSGGPYNSVFRYLGDGWEIARDKVNNHGTSFRVGQSSDNNDKYFGVDVADDRLHVGINGYGWDNGDNMIAIIAPKPGEDINSLSGAIYTSGDFNFINPQTFRDGLSITGGRLGVGTSTPASSLFISGEAGVNPFTIASSTGATMLSMLQNGNLGLGTATPVSKLHLIETNSASVPITLQNTSSSGFSAIHFRDSNGVISGHIGYGNSSAASLSDKFYFGSVASKEVVLTSNNVARLTVQTDGDFGFNTALPDSRVHIYEDTSKIGLKVESPNLDTVISLKNTGVNGREYWIDSGSQGAGVGAGNFAIYDPLAAATRFVINSTGNIGIGTTTPTYTLDVIGTGQFTTNSFQGSSLVLSRNAYATQKTSITFLPTGTLNSANPLWTVGLLENSSAFDFSTWNGTTQTPRLRIDTSGNVGIGTNFPLNKLSIVETSNSSAAFLQSANTTVDLLVLQNSASNGYSSIGFKNSSGVSVGGFGYANASAVNFADKVYFYSNARDMGFSTNGGSVELLTLKASNGNVGIGTTTPNTRLSVVGNVPANQVGVNLVNNSSTGYAALRLGLDGTQASGGALHQMNSGWSGTGAYLPNTTVLAAFDSGGLSVAAQNASGVIRFYTGGSADGNERLRIASDGNIGIGTSTPGYKLTVRETSGAWGASIGGGSTNPPWVNIGGTGTLGMIQAYTNTFSGTTPLAIQPYGGNLGIGTTTPAVRLDVQGYTTGDTFRVTNYQSLTAGGQMTFNVDAAGRTFLNLRSTNYAAFGGAYFNATGNEEAWFMTETLSNSSGNRVMRFGNSRNGVFDTTNGTFAIQKLNDAKSAVLTTPFQISNAAPTASFILNSSGNVGIGTTTPGQKLVVIGGAQFTGVGSGAYAFDLNLTSDGTLTTSASDQRLKKNIQLLNATSTLEKLMQLKPSSFDWKSNEAHDIGLIAQEVEEVFPELVFTNQADGYKGVNYSRLPALLIAGVQQISRQVSSLYDGIAEVFVKSLRVKDEICIDDVCLNKEQLRNLLQDETGNGSEPQGGGNETGSQGNSEDQSGTSGDTVPPDESGSDTGSGGGQGTETDDSGQTSIDSGSSDSTSGDAGSGSPDAGSTGGSSSTDGGGSSSGDSSGGEGGV